MKTGEKLAAGWLLTLGFMFLSLSASAILQKNSIQKANFCIQGECEMLPTENSDKNDNTAVGGLIFGIPSAILGGWLALGLYRQSQQDKKAINQKVNDHLQSLFYRMIQENNGRVTLLGFAMQSQLPAPVAKQYLDDQAKLFNANFKISEEGGVSYHFDV
ncbi:MAG: hypothetical protein IGS49_03725 [Chlorogloeopsis fritschii C42_A2020_084]|jgi:hypothetical protein|uniref:hypothetical protein n=1 Tax=Chlorogloeopsis fritschii TaxID=1124 RepID=UPI0019F3A633|nr:hypothetical protein [Chlorogloeopsis fritschii]MBF2004584.1 hypothetical protein [Chlorogloeopsis fritschii C42_A2020_084]